MHFFIRWALKWLVDPVANPRTSQKWKKLNQEMIQIVKNMKKAVNKNTRSRTAIGKTTTNIHCQRIRGRVPEDCMWNCNHCNNEIEPGEDCFACVECEKAYHDLCQVNVKDVLCIRTQKANLKNPQQTLDQDEDEALRTLSMGDASVHDSSMTLWSAVPQSTKTTEIASITTSTPARNLDEDDRISIADSEVSNSFLPQHLETSRASLNNTI